MLTPHEKNSMLQMIEKLWAHTDAMPTTTPCQSCRFYSHGNCLEADNEPIPADVSPVGCPMWQFNPDSMPF